jgi:hypothetical protein
MRIQGKDGRVEQLSDEPRRVRTLRVTDSVWAEFGHVADRHGVTRADLLEQLVHDVESDWQVYAYRPSLEQLLESLPHNPTVTRKGKDGGAVRRVCNEIATRLGLSG